MISESKLFNPIGGTETEHDTLDPRGATTIAHVLEALRRYGPHFGRVYGKRLWLMNAGLAYGEVSNKAEFAGPECSNGYEAMLYEYAGSILWALMALWADLDQGRLPSTWILKTNTSHNGDSSGGGHINVSMPRRESSYPEDLQAVIEVLKAFVVTLQVLVGAGVVLPRERASSLLRGKDYNYAISARGFHVSLNAGEANRVATVANGHKPIFLRRPEALADSNLFWRLQICGLDSNILPRSIRLKLDLLLLMAEMVIQGAIEPIIIREPSESALSMRQVSLNWRTNLEIEGRGSMTAREIQLHYYGQAEKFVSRYSRPAWQRLLRQWERMLRALDTDDNIPRDNFGRSDWVTKAVLLEQRAERFERQDRPFTYDQAERLHFAYHSYRFDGRGLCLPLLLMRRFGPPGLGRAVNRALWEAPVDTRAWSRGEAVRYGPPGLALDWKTTGGIPGVPPIDQGDPRVVATPAFQVLLDQWAKERERK